MGDELRGKYNSDFPSAEGKKLYPFYGGRGDFPFAPGSKSKSNLTEYRN
jgi:hypothetical protein